MTFSITVWDVNWDTLLCLLVNSTSTGAKSRQISRRDGLPPDCRPGRTALPGELQAEHR